METKLLKKNKKYVIGVSGGPDSMFLLDNIYNQELDINNFIVCLINYYYRKDSDNDEKIVVEYCQKRNIKVYVKKITEIDYQQYYYNYNSYNFQAIARNLRYDFFLQISEKYNCQGVLIAHNLNDHIETYILQKKRNGIFEYYGLNKISNYSYLLGKKLKILRIMLKISREEIIEYLFNKKINYAIDSTNILAIYNRNIIRNEIKHINLRDILLEIKQKNKENKQLKLIAKNYLIENFGKININNFNIIDNIKLKKIIIFNYFKNNKVAHLINNKKRKFLDEIIKELKSLKPNIIIKINLNYSLIKSYNNVKIVNNDLIKTTTIKITPTTILPIKWKKNIINLGTKNNYDFKITAAQWPIIITNDLSLLRNVMINKINLNRWFIKNKVSFLARKSYFVLDKNSNIIFVNNLVNLKINEFIKY